MVSKLLSCLMLLFCIQSCLCVLDQNHSDLFKFSSVSEISALDKGRSNEEESSKFENGSSSLKQESGNFSNKEDNKSGHEVAEHSAGQSGSYGVNQVSHERKNKGGANKWYQKSGFVNKYHKDESENKESYYEDSSDEKKHSARDSQNDFSGQRLEDSYKNGRHDSSLQGYNRDYNANVDRYNGQSEYEGNYNANSHNDVRHNYLHDAAVQRYFDRNGNEIYHQRGHQSHHNPYDYPYHYSRSGPYALDYYPQDFYRNRPTRFYDSTPATNDGDYSHYYPENARYYSNSHNYYYDKENDNYYNNVYLTKYFPDNYNYKDEDVDVY